MLSNFLYASAKNPLDPFELSLFPITKMGLIPPNLKESFIRMKKTLKNYVELPSYHSKGTPFCKQLRSSVLNSFHKCLWTTIGNYYAFLLRATWAEDISL